MFNWDGTDVTSLIEKMDIYEAKYNSVTYWVLSNGSANDIHTQNHQDIAIVKSATSTAACFIDEAKEIFGLFKIGTHWCRMGRKIKILLKPSISPFIESWDNNFIKGEQLNVITEETNLPKYRTIHKEAYNKHAKMMAFQLREIFTFRELMGITCSFESSIVVRENRNGIPLCISYYEPNMKLEDGKIIPFTILDQYFTEITIDDMVKNMLKITDVEEMAVVLHQIRNKLEEIIERTDRDNISYKTLILNRITERLQTAI